MGTLKSNIYSFKNYIIEASYSKKDIPKYFRVAIDIRYKKHAIDDLANMKLIGVEGISSSGDIIYEFLGSGREGFLMMDANEVISLNKLTRFMYDNPHYFFSENMWAMKRLFNKRIDDNKGTWHNIADYVFQEMVRERIVNKFDLQATAPGQSISYTKAVNTTVNSLKDFVNVFRKACIEVNDEKKDKTSYYYFMPKIIELSDDRLQDIVIKAFHTRISWVYVNEGEWIVKNKILEVPKNSYLYILTNYSDKDIEDYQSGKWKDDLFRMMRDEKYIKEEIELRNNITTKGIDKKYILKFVNAVKWDEIKKLHIEKGYKK